MRPARAHEVKMSEQLAPENMSQQASESISVYVILAMQAADVRRSERKQANANKISSKMESHL